MSGLWHVVAGLVATAYAAPSDAGHSDEAHVRIARADVVEQFAAWAMAQGRVGPAAVPVCRPFAEGAQLCAVVERDGGRRLATRADGVDLGALERSLASKSSDTRASMERRVVEGTTGALWVRARGDGRDHDVLVDPVALERAVGAPLVVAAPTRDLLVAWSAGDPVFDRIVAVGILKACDADPSCASALGWRWDGAAWRPWGQAVRAADVPSPGMPSGTTSPR